MSDTSTPEAEARLHALARTMPRTYAAALGEALELLGEARRERDALRPVAAAALEVCCPTNHPWLAPFYERLGKLRTVARTLRASGWMPPAPSEGEGQQP